MAHPQYAGQKDKIHNTGTLIYVSDGTNFYPIKGDSSGYPILGAGTARIGTVSGVLKEIRTSVDIGSTDCTTFVAGDIMGNDDCCTTTATYWTFATVARVNGGYGRIISATLVSEMENQAVQYDLLLFNATPTNTLLSNSANDNPQKEDISKYLGTIVFPQSTARGADVATYADASPASTSTNLPMAFKCVTVDDLYGILVTRTGYDHTDNDAIEIALLVEQY